MSKANDNIPADEMLLAEMLAAVKVRGLGHCVGKRFATKDGWETSKAQASRCCALGALEIADVIDNANIPSEFSDTWRGNDYDTKWRERPDDLGESLGWAFRCAMTEEP